jgi:predicted oxidoreductase
MSPPSAASADVIVVGGGLSGLVAAAELADAGRRVIVVDQEPEVSLGGQAFWSLGGLFLVDSPEQRRCGIKDSIDLAMRDWMDTAAFDRPEDEWPGKWAAAYVNFAAGEKRAWLREQGIKLMPTVGWAERGGLTDTGPGNSVPRFHITWGTGPGVIEPFERRVRDGVARGNVELRFRHQVDELIVSGGAVTGVRGSLLKPVTVQRSEDTTREVVGEFELSASVVIVASGGIGGNLELVKRNWPERLGTPPEHMVAGVPAHVDGRMLAITAKAGGQIINPDRMWHYVEGLHNWAPIWSNHGIRILPGPSSLWLDGNGRRLPAPNYPGFDTLGTLEHLRTTGHDHSWFILTQKIIEKEFALSGSEQNPDITGKSIRAVVKSRLGKGAPGPVAAFQQHGADFVHATSIDELVKGMNGLTDMPLLDVEVVREAVAARDSQMDNSFSKDGQAIAITTARQYMPDKLQRVAAPHRITDPDAGPMIAVKLTVLTRKSLGGIHTDLESRVLGADGAVIPGLYAVGEAAGFGGGGVHGYRALEGTFLGGCLFSGRAAGRAAVAAL